MISRPIPLLALAAAMALGCESSEAAQRSQTLAQELRSSWVSAVADAAPDTTLAHALSSAFRRAANQALGAVVYVTVEQAQEFARSRPDIPQPFERFFQFPEQGGGQVPPQRGSGSGFIFDEAGYVMTNHHVVDNASRVTVRLQNGREYSAEVVGSDPSTDVAVIKLQDIGNESLPVATFGNSDALQVGDWVLALGNPLGLDFTVTAGIVSAKGRQLTARENALEAFIQTDAAINQGNSGGPLIDLDGRVVGINSAIYGASRFVGYGFAVPINLATRVSGDLLEFGFVRRPKLGMRINDVTAVDAEAFGLDEVRGADIVAIDENTPAASSGLQVGDVVIALDGQRIDNAAQLTTSLARREPGETVELTVIRAGDKRTVSVELGEFAHENEGPRREAEDAGAEQTMGFAVRPLTPQIASRFGHEATDGVVISDVRRFSPASNAGLRPGQILRQINGEVVETPADVEEIAQSIGHNQVVSIRVRDPNLGETIVNFRVRG
jgi:serine protease Do